MLSSYDPFVLRRTKSSASAIRESGPSISTEIRWIFSPSEAIGTEIFEGSTEEISALNYASIGIRFRVSTGYIMWYDPSLSH